MQRSTVLVALAVVAALLVTVPAVGMAVTDEDGQDEQAVNETAPGEQLSGVVGVGEAELQGEIDQRGFGIQISRAASDGERADRVAERLTDVENRLSNLEQRKSSLDQQRADNEISEGKYRAEIARLAAETETARGLANTSSQAAGQLPADVREQRNINVTAIQTLQDRANKLAGQDVAETARGIAGDRIGDRPGGDRPVDIPAGDREDGGQNATAGDRAGDRQGGQAADDELSNDDRETGADDRQ